MSENFRRQIFTHVLTPVTLSEGDTVIFRAPMPMRIMRWGINVTTTINSTATAGVYALDRRPTPASDTGRVEVSRITLAVAEDIAAGKVLRKAVGTAATETVPSTGVIVTAGGIDGHEVNVGDEIVFAVVAAADTAAGAGVPFFEYIQRGAEDNDQTDAVDK